MIARGVKSHEISPPSNLLVEFKDAPAERQPRYSSQDGYSIYVCGERVSMQGNPVVADLEYSSICACATAVRLVLENFCCDLKAGDVKGKVGNKVDRPTR